MDPGRPVPTSVLLCGTCKVRMMRVTPGSSVAVGEVRAPVKFCKGWRCLRCHKQVLAADRARFEAGIRGFSKGLALVTLVLRGRFHDMAPAKGYAQLARGLRRFLSALKKQTGPFEFLWVYEAHGSDILHLHLLVSGHLAALVAANRVREAIRVVKDLSATSGLGFSKKPVSGRLVKPADARRMAGYLNKKDALPVYLPIGKRRYGASAGFLPKRAPVADPAKPRDWLFIRVEPVHSRPKPPTPSIQPQPPTQTPTSAGAAGQPRRSP